MQGVQNHPAVILSLISQRPKRQLKYAKDKEKGSFNPSKERDELSLGLGNKEHTGRTRG